jgi:hypothetical protein
MAQRTSIAQKDADLAVLHLAGRATVLAGDAGRVLPFVENASLVEDQYAVGVPQMLEDLAAQLIPPGIRIPIGAAQHILEAVRRRRAAHFRDVPTSLALRLTEQAAQIRQDPVAGLRAGERAGQPARHIGQVGLAAGDGAGRRIRRGRT